MSDRRAKPTKADLQAASRLKALWKDRAKGLGLTQERMAEIMDVTQGAVSQYINGAIPLNYNAVLAFANALGVLPTDIRSDLPEQLRVVLSSDEDFTDITGFGQAASLGSGSEANEWAESHKLKFKISSLRRKGLLGHKLSVFYGDGESMMPRIRSGDALLFDESDTTPRDETIYVIQWRGEYFAKISEVLDGKIYFRSLNPVGDHVWKKAKRMDDERDPIRIIGRVRWIGSWED
jgi:transcriptional regulator with XRE-family HTH domain